MRILIINYEYPPLGGGGGVATQQIARELSKRHSVHVLTTWYPGLERNQIDEGVRVHRVRVWGRAQLPTATIRSMVTFVPAAIWRGLRLLKKEAIDVIHAWFVIPSGLPALCLARLFRIPFVLTLVGGEIFDPSKGVSPHRHGGLRWLVRAVAEAADVRTAISSDIVQKAREFHGVRGDITVAHLGLVPFPDMVTAPSHDAFVTVGRLIARKRYDVLLRAWREVPGAKLIIVGDGPLREQLESLARELGIEERVKFRGFESEETKRELLAGALGYVSATEHEGFGIVFLEAMEAGIPIVATDHGGQRDFLENGENALLVPVGDEGALARAVRRLLEDGEMRERMARANRGKVKDFYLDRTARRYEEVITRAYESRD